MAHFRLERVVFQSTPVTSNGVAYATGEQIGAVNTITQAVADTRGTVQLESIVVIDKHKQKAAIDVFFFDQVPALTSVDNGAFTLPTAELLKCIGVVSIAAADYADTAAQAVATVRRIDLILQAVAKKRDLYYVLVSRGTPTYASTSGLVLKFGLLQP